MPEEPGEIITIAEVKTLLQITGTSKDTLITALIPIVESDLLEYLNNDFDEEYPPGLKGYLAKMIGYRLDKTSDNVASETVSRYSVSYKSGADFIAGYPSTIMTGLSKWRKAKF